MAGIPALPISELAYSDHPLFWGDRKALEACQTRRYIMFPNEVLILSCTKVLLTPHFVDKSATRYRMFDRKPIIYVFNELCFCSPGDRHCCSFLHYFAGSGVDTLL